MSIGLSIAGRYPISGVFVKGPSPADWLASVQEWLARKEGDDLVSAQVVEGPEGDVLLAQLHPFAEELQVTCPSTGHVLVTAGTHACGPGYHQHLCDLLREMSTDLKVTWSPSDDDHRDDTGFFEGADREKLETDMLALLAELARDLPGSSAAPPALLLPPTTPGFLHGLAVSTPMGPRDAAWLERARGAGTVALDAFPWRMRGRTAEHYRDRALALMWSEVRWRAPSNEAESAVQLEVLRCLLRAHEKGAKDLPGAEWRELLSFHDAGDDARSAAESAPSGGPLVGYRRGDVLARLPGEFRMRLPGAFNEDVDEEGTWSGTDGERAVYVTVARLPPRGEAPADASASLARTAFEGEPFEMRGARVIGRAALRRDTDDDGQELWVLAMGAASGSFLMRATLTFAKDADRDWALACFRSIDRGEDVASPGGGGGGLAGISSIG